MIYIPSDNFSFRVDVYNTVSGAVLTCKVYGEEDTPNGTVPYLDSFNIIPNVTDASLYSSERRPTKKGIRVQAVNVVYTGSGNVQRGQIFVRGMMFYGDTDTIPAVVLFSDYVTSKNSPGYPGTGLVDSLSGKGYDTYTDITPAGSTSPYDIPVNIVQRMRTIDVGVTTGSTAGARGVAVIIESYEDGGKFFREAATGNFPIEGSYEITFADIGVNTGVNAIDNTMTAPMPSNLFLSSPNRLVIQHLAQSGDTLDTIVYKYEQFIAA